MKSLAMVLSPRRLRSRERGGPSSGRPPGIPGIAPGAGAVYFAPSFFAM